MPLGMCGSIRRDSASTAVKNENQPRFCCGARGGGPIIAGGSSNSSSMWTPSAFRALGLCAISTSSGTMTVRLQYDILSR